jgi:hypothetical protein
MFHSSLLDAKLILHDRAAFIPAMTAVIACCDGAGPGTPA